MIFQPLIEIQKIIYSIKNYFLSENQLQFQRGVQRAVQFQSAASAKNGC